MRTPSTNREEREIRTQRAIGRLIERFRNEWYRDHGQGD